MTPWPEVSNDHSPTMQQPNDMTNPFASFGSAKPPGMPFQCNANQQAPAPSVLAPPPKAAPPAAPLQQPHEQTPPPQTVFADPSQQSPPSPMGDMSVLAQMNAATAAAAAHAAPSAAPSVSYLTQQGVQPLAVQPTTLQPMPMAQQPVAPVNPFDFGGDANFMPTAPPPAAMPPMAPPVPAMAPVAQPTASPPLSPVPPQSFAPQQGFADPFGYALSPMVSPVVSPGASPRASPTAAMMASALPNANPFGAAAPPFMPGTQDPSTGAQQQAVVPSAAPNADPFGVFGSGPQPASANAHPFGSSALVASGAPAPGGGAVDDPFGIFGAATPVAPQAAPMQQPTLPVAEEDPWAAAGFGSQAPTSTAAATATPQQSTQPTDVALSTSTSSLDAKTDEAPITLDSNNLPSEGEYYECRVNSRTLGAMFYTSRNLENTLFYKMPANVTEALGSRPVVAYVAEKSAAHNNGIHLGHVVLTVNGQDIQNPEFCAESIRNASRPMNLRCYVPPALELTLNEGTHMVKYDTKDLEAPSSSTDWKCKYVVVGGIVTKPWMMNMFYRKRDYDVAVKEAHSGHKMSVKVKQFDLRGARIILKGKDGKPNWVDYRSERKPWYYITILPNRGYPIKISANTFEELEPVYSAVRRFVKTDMESQYQRGMEQSFGDMRNGGGGGYGVASRGNSGSSAARVGEFSQFGDDPNRRQPDQSSNLHDKWR